LPITGRITINLPVISAAAITANMLTTEPQAYRTISSVNDQSTAMQLLLLLCGCL